MLHLGHLVGHPQSVSGGAVLRRQVFPLPRAEELTKAPSPSVRPFAIRRPHQQQTEPNIFEGIAR